MRCRGNSNSSVAALTLKVGVHFRYKDQNNRESRFAFCYASRPMRIVKAISTPTGKLGPRHNLETQHSATISICTKLQHNL